MNIVVRLDYATVNFTPHSMSYTKIGKILLDDPAAMCWRTRGLSENAPMVSPLGLRWTENNGYAEMPHKLEISGVGISHFSAVLPDLMAAAEHRFSRLDFAFDVLLPRAAWRAFIVRAFDASLNSERQRKCYRLTGTGEAMTIYIGSRKSAKFLRIYNKTLEDPRYQFVQDGVAVDVPEDHCVIRYEVELKRHVVTAQNDKRVFDPSPAFSWYYGEPEEQQRLCEEIRKIWLSFGDEVLLPEGFADAGMSCLMQNANFASKTQDQRMEEVREKLHDYPRSFEHTLGFLVSRFGKYVPYILADPAYIAQCEDACRLEFGFVPEYYLEQSKPQGWYDLDEDDDPEPAEVEDLAQIFEQLDFGHIDLIESEV